MRVPFTGSTRTPRLPPTPKPSELVSTLPSARLGRMLFTPTVARLMPHMRFSPPPTEIQSLILYEAVGRKLTPMSSPFSP